MPTQFYWYLTRNRGPRVFAEADFEQEWFEGWEPENLLPIPEPEETFILQVIMNNNWLNGWEP